MTTIQITYGGETVTMRCDLAQAGAPIYVEGSAIVYRTADARHGTAEAVRLAARSVWPECGDFADGSEAWNDLAYKTVDG